MPPPSYRAGYDLLVNDEADMITKTTMALSSAALTVYVTSTTTSSIHIARRALATKVAVDPDSYAREFAIAVLVTQTAPFNDATINTGVMNAWNTIAGA